MGVVGTRTMKEVKNGAAGHDEEYLIT